MNSENNKSNPIAGRQLWEAKSTVAEPPTEDGWYDLIGDGAAQSFYFLEGGWYEDEDEARVDEHHSEVDVENMLWLRPVSDVRMDRPKVICYCGSLRVEKEAFQKAEYECLMRGEIALLPCCMFVDIEREYGTGSDYKQKADDQHKRKIDMCDEVFVLNVGGYIGESTRSEIEYAKSINKPVKYLEL